MINVFYYYYYLFYTKVLVQPEPHFVSILALSFVESLWINGLIDGIAVNWFCYKFGKWSMISVALGIIAFNSWYYHVKHNASNIVKTKPTFWGSHVISASIVIALSLIGVSWLFWGSFLTRSLLAQCQ